MPEPKRFPKPFSLKWRILIPFIGGLILLIAVFAYSVFAIEGYQLQITLKHDLDRIAAYQKDSLALRGEKLSVIAEAMTDDPRLIRALATGDRKALSGYGRPAFERISKDHNVSHLNFLDSQRRVVLRVHDPSLAGSMIDDLAALDDALGGEFVSGVALGKSGSYVVRAMVPVYEEERLIGYVALGEEVMDSLVDLSRAFGVDAYVLLYKKHLTREDWEHFMRVLGRKPEWERYPEMVISAQTRQEVPKAMDALLAGTEKASLLKSTTVEARRRLYNIGSVPLLDFTGQKVGRLVVVHDVTDENRQTLMRLSLVVGIALAVGALLSVFFYFHLRRTEDNLVDAQAHIFDDAKEHEAEQRRHIEELTGRLDELERFEQLTVGRELRIKALKDENRRLKALSGSGGESEAGDVDNADERQGGQSD